MRSNDSPFVSRSCLNLGHDIVLQLLHLARYASTTRLSAAHRTAAELLPSPGASRHVLTNGCSDLQRHCSMGTIVQGVQATRETEY